MLDLGHFFLLTLKFNQSELCNLLLHLMLLVDGSLLDRGESRRITTEERGDRRLGRVDEVTSFISLAHSATGTLPLLDRL